MRPSKIEWLHWPDGHPGYSWNPIRGECPVGCFYCYGRKFYKRFKWNPEIRLDLNELMASFPKKPSRIFVCSTFELFHPLAKPYRNNIFKHIGLLSEHTFFILTKCPENIDRPMPENVWLGTSVEDNSNLWRAKEMYGQRQGPAKYFLSLEPFMGRISMPEFTIVLGWIKWLIIGRLTGHGKKYDPKPEWIIDIVKVARKEGIPIFMKNNLLHKPRPGSIIWPGNLIKEFPKEGDHD